MKKYFKILIAVVLYLSIIVINSNVYAMEGIVTKNTVRLREKASTDSSIVSLVAQDQKVEIVKEDGEWYKIKYTDDGNTYSGFIRKDMVEVEGSEADSSKDTSSTETKTEEETSNEEKATSEEKKETEEAKSDESEEVANNEENKQVQEIVLEEKSKVKIKNKLNVKILPLINLSTMSKINEGSEITIVEILGNWCYVESENKSGWTLLNKIEQLTEEAQSEKSKEEENKEEDKNEEQSEEKKEKLSKIAYISATTVNLREKADSSSNIIEKLSINTKVSVVEETNNGWSKVEVSGKTGYVSSQYLSDEKTEVSSRGEDEAREKANDSNKEEDEEKKEESSKSNNTNESSSKSSKEKEDEDNSSSSSSTSGASVVAYAKKYLGSSYVWGASGPNSFDCSGFTMYVYKHFGYNLSHSSGAQASAGKSVSRSNLQQGDLVCYSGHVGIYAGGGKIVHAYNSRAGVVVTDMDALYNKIVAYRRILD